MLGCKTCGACFEEADTKTEQERLGEFICTSYTGVCPECGSSRIEEANECGVCGEWTVDGDFCKYCKDIVRTIIKNTIARSVFPQATLEAVATMVCEVGDEIATEEWRKRRGKDE